MPVHDVIFETRAMASAAAARHIVAALKRGLTESDQVSLIVSGGTTPASCFRLLADTRLDWQRVQIIPSDERCVPSDHDASNQAMLQRLLITGRAANANLVALYDPGLDAGEQCAAFEQRWRAVPRPPELCMLGMGTDGHFASLFPDWAGIDEGLDPLTEASSMLVQTGASDYPRMTLTLPVFVQCRDILLLVFGEDKRDVLKAARSAHSRLPVSRLIQQQQTTVRVFWAP